jgi:hypothetical protein
MEDTVTTTPVPGGSLITPVLVKPKKELMTKQRWNKTLKRAGRKEAVSARAAEEKVAAEQEREADTSCSFGPRPTTPRFKCLGIQRTKWSSKNVMPGLTSNFFVYFI